MNKINTKTKEFTDKSSLSVFKLINKHFWKSKIGPIAGFLLPFFFMVIYKIIGHARTDGIFENGLASYLSFGILPLCLISLPQIIVDLKTSIILRKIAVSPVTPLKFCLILLGYYFLAITISTSFVILIFATFLNKQAPETFNKISWGQMVYALLNIFITSLAVGLFMGITIKKTNLVQILGAIGLLISCAFAGQLIPLSVLATSDAMRYIQLFSPLTYGLSMMNNVLITPNIDQLTMIPPASNISPEEVNRVIQMCSYTSIFDLKHPFIWPKIRIGVDQNGLPMIFEITPLTFYTVWQKALNLVMPYVVTGTFVGVSVWKFNWTSR